jgi:hypothetical protein
MADKITRTEFVRAYASRSGLEIKWAELGFIQMGEKYRLAMPCMCDDESCKGWQMVGPEFAPDIAESLLNDLKDKEGS